MKKLEFWKNINSQKTNFIALSLKNFDTFIWNIRLDKPENSYVQNLRKPLRSQSKRIQQPFEELAVRKRFNPLSANPTK